MPATLHTKTHTLCIESASGVYMSIYNVSEAAAVREQIPKPVSDDVKIRTMGWFSFIARGTSRLVCHRGVNESGWEGSLQP